MKWFQNLFRPRSSPIAVSLEAVQEKFSHFRVLLDQNNRVLQRMSDMEEKSQGEYLFDTAYIRTNTKEIQQGVREIIKHLIALGGDAYSLLEGRYQEINAELEPLVAGHASVLEDEMILPFSAISRSDDNRVGGKNANLGEILSQLGLPVPMGFAITAWSYRRFLDANNLQERITEKLSSVDIHDLGDLKRISNEIQDMIISCPVPTDLTEKIQEYTEELVERFPNCGLAVRSSAIGEDSEFSFAGQYGTLLNVKRCIVDCYREVLASKFSPKAIYYCLSHSFMESDMAMSVGCMVMVDASAGGVIYTRDPIHPHRDCILVHAVPGLGKCLVDGTAVPDVYRVSRLDGSLMSSRLGNQPFMLVVGEDEGIVEKPIGETERERHSISEDQLRTLLQYALKIEDHYGAPQDIEWAADQEGNIHILQSRPLRLIEEKTVMQELDCSGFKVLLSGGTTVCPGAGGGAVYKASNPDHLRGMPSGAVLVSPQPFPGLVAVMDRTSALVTQGGSEASHMATLAREYRIPTLVDVDRTQTLRPGQVVTVDATKGIIYEDLLPDLIEARKPDFDFGQGASIFNLLKQVLDKVSTLNLVDPADPSFIPENCRTFHDITRFAHQKSMEEMFSSAKNVRNKERIGLRLKSDIPLPVYILHIDRDIDMRKAQAMIAEDQLDSIPMQAFWGGVKEEGWPSPPSAAKNFKGFVSVLSTTMTMGHESEFSESSFAIISEEYMIASLFLGYHFTTVEAMCTSTISNNYIRIQLKGGGSSFDRRCRRIQLIQRLLTALGFDSQKNGDFIHGVLAYQTPETIAGHLRILGRLAMVTKQLDMALSNDSVAEWYTQDLMQKFGIVESVK